MPIKTKTRLSVTCEDCEKPFDMDCENVGELETAIIKTGWMMEDDRTTRCPECANKYRDTLCNSENIYERIKGGKYRVREGIEGEDRVAQQKLLDIEFKKDVMAFLKLDKHTSASKPGWLDKVFTWAAN